MNTGRVVDEAEYVVVGTGVGGGTAARELAKRGKDVIMLEKGKYFQRLGTSLTLMSMALNHGVITTNEGYTSASAIMTGGSSVVTGGSFADPPGYLKDKWGIDLSREVEETRKELGVQKMPENLCGAGSMKVMEAANSLGYHWQRLDKVQKTGYGSRYCNRDPDQGRLFRQIHSLCGNRWGSPRGHHTNR